jgi:hypothetical protein
VRHCEVTTFRSAGESVSDWSQAGRSRGRSSSHGEGKTFFLSTSSRPILGPTPPPVLWVPCDTFGGDPGLRLTVSQSVSMSWCRICSVITRWSESRRTRNHILLSHMRLPQLGGPGSRIYIPQEQGSLVKPHYSGLVRVYCNMTFSPK